MIASVIGYANNSTVQSRVCKKVTGGPESIRVIESTRGVAYQIHHSNDFLVRRRVFVSIRVAPESPREEMTVRIQHRIDICDAATRINRATWRLRNVVAQKFYVARGRAARFIGRDRFAAGAGRGSFSATREASPPKEKVRPIAWKKLAFSRWMWKEDPGDLDWIRIARSRLARRAGGALETRMKQWLVKRRNNYLRPQGRLLILPSSHSEDVIDLMDELEGHRIRSSAWRRLLEPLLEIYNCSP